MHRELIWMRCNDSLFRDNAFEDDRAGQHGPAAIPPVQLVPGASSEDNVVGALCGCGVDYGWVVVFEWGVAQGQQVAVVNGAGADFGLVHLSGGCAVG